MISFPLGILLIPYGLFLLAFLVLSIVNIYHLTHYGEATKTSYAYTAAYCAVAAAILVLSMLNLASIDWSQPFSLQTPGFFENAELPRL